MDISSLEEKEREIAKEWEIFEGIVEAYEGGFKYITGCWFWFDLI